MIHPTRNPSRPVSFLIILAVAFVMASLVTRDASAEHRPRNLDIALDQLDVSVVRGRLHVTYEVNRHDWRMLKKLHIRPRLNLYLPKRPGVFEFVQSAPITSRAATIEYSRDLTPRRGRYAEVRLSGERGRTKIATTSYGSSCASRIRIALQRPSRRHHDRGHHGNEVAVIESCSRNTTWSGDLNQCIAKAQGIESNAPATINACGASTSWSGDFLSCLDLAGNLGRSSAATIRACESATSWSGDFKSCLKSAAAYHGDAAPTINACKAATDWSGDFKDCVNDARRLGYRAPQIVNACGNATSWSGEFKQCLAAAHRS